MQMKYNDDLQKIFEIQSKIKNVHPFLKKVFPVAIVENDSFFIFDAEPSTMRYVFVKNIPTEMQIPKGIRAAFPLECYENKIACIITGEIFDSLEGYVTIFHEFIHCQQWEICEVRLKQTLEVAQKSIARNDYMWEINYPFPYGNSKIVETYFQFLEALEENNLEYIYKYRNQLKRILHRDDFEYMVWQEWKEGFARFIENKISRELGLSENHYGREGPFNRATFYEGGSKYIEFLGVQEPKLLIEIEKLFSKMLNSTF